MWTWTQNGTTRKPGKDRAFVFVLCGGSRDGGARTPAPSELIAGGLVSDREVLIGDVASGLASGREVIIVPHPLQDTVSPLLHATAAHETAHVFLEDEYGGSPRIPDDTAAQLANIGNVQAENDLLTPEDPNKPNGPKVITGKEIKWRWPRIEVAGVLDKKPESSGAASFTLTLQQRHAFAFAEKLAKVLGPAKLIAHLRRRPLRSKHPKESDLSGRLQITNVSPTIGQIEVTVLDGFTLNPADYPGVTDDPSKEGGSVLLVPVPAPASAAALGDDHAELVARIIRDHIIKSKAPLTGLPCEKDDGVIQKPSNLPGGLPKGRPRRRAWIVGLYSGGATFYCGVYHPTGACIMRTLQVPERDASGARIRNAGAFYPFCPVCRYVLVDQLDPSQHGAIDKDYDKRGYPQP